MITYLINSLHKFTKMLHKTPPKTFQPWLAIFLTTAELLCKAIFICKFGPYVAFTKKMILSCFDVIIYKGFRNAQTGVSHKFNSKTYETRFSIFQFHITNSGQNNSVYSIWYLRHTWNCDRFWCGCKTLNKNFCQMFRTVQKFDQFSTQGKQTEI